MKRFKNLGYSRFATARSTEAGAQPPGFTKIRIRDKIVVLKREILNLKAWLEQASSVRPNDAVKTGCFTLPRRKSRINLYWSSE